MSTLITLTPFARAYVAAIYFTDAGEQDLTKDSEFSPEALARIEKDCAEFEAKAGDNMTGLKQGCADSTERERAAHDFWLTRNSHGCGFWDGDWAEPQASFLDQLAKSFGSCDAYTGDDGLIYFI